MKNGDIKIDRSHAAQHNYLIYCNDILVRWLHWADDNKISKISVDLNTEELTQSFEKAENILEWLKNNGYEKEMYKLYRRHILCSLVADFCHYMIESIMCAAKMKPAVAYALLRKPLRDNLAYIEWLRVNPEEMINKLLYDQPEEYDLKKEQKRQHIEQICSQYRINRIDGMFVFRYEKNDEKSLERIWNKANHIVTTQNYTRSSHGELNFVFMDERRCEQYTSYYYTVVPLIMSYAIELIVSMFEEIAEVNNFTATINKAMQLLHRAYGIGIKNYEKAILDVKGMPLICPYCGGEFEMSDRIIDRFMNNKFKCKKCRSKINSTNYIFDFENLNQYIEKGEMK